jgi:hypothetical protein
VLCLRDNSDIAFDGTYYRLYSANPSYLVLFCPQGPPAPQPNRTSTLIVIKHVDNSAGGQSASDFTMHVSGNNALPTDFAGSESGATVKLSEGPYGVSEDNPNPARYTASVSVDCSAL